MTTDPVTILYEDINIRRLFVPLFYILIAIVYASLIKNYRLPLRRLYFTSFTVVLLFFCLQKGRMPLLLLLFVTISYVHTKALLGWHWMPATNFGLQLALLIASDNYAKVVQDDPFSIMVFHTAIMMLFVRMATFGYDMSDAHLVRMTQAQKEPQPICVALKMHERFPNRLDLPALEAFPSYFEYLSYVFFPISIMYGPNMRFADYRNMMKRTDSCASPKNEPRSKRISYVLWGICVLSCGYALLVHYCPLGGELVAESTLNSALWKRMVTGYMSFERYRWSLYLFWYLTELAFLLLGLGHNPTSGKWDFYMNLVPEILSTTSSYSDLWIYWNIHAHKFLKDYVYKRFRIWSGSGPTLAGFFTFAMSSAWHGASSGKWAIFINMIFVEISFEGFEELIKESKFKWLFLIPNRFAFTYFIMPGFLTGQQALIMWHSWYYYGHALGCVYLLCSYLGSKRKNRHHEAPLRIKIE